MFHFSVKLAKWLKDTLRNYTFEFGDHYNKLQAIQLNIDSQGIKVNRKHSLTYVIIL